MSTAGTAPVAPGTYELGPADATLLVHTRKGGAASKAGHDLEIVVEAWSATLRVDADPARSALELTADSRSLRVREGTGGVMTLDEDDKAGITRTIDEEVLKGGTIVFRSTRVTGAAGRLDVAGELEVLGTSRPQSFAVAFGADGHLSGRATVRQTDHGMKPYSALFGTLKVLDEVEITVEGTLPTRKDTDG